MSACQRLIIMSRLALSVSFSFRSVSTSSVNSVTCFVSIASDAIVSSSRSVSSPVIMFSSCPMPDKRKGIERLYSLASLVATFAPILLFPLSISDRSPRLAPILLATSV